MRVNNISPGLYSGGSLNISKFNRTPVFKNRSIPDALVEKVPLGGLKDFTVREYKKLQPQEIKLINSRIKAIYKSVFDLALKYHDAAAGRIKKNLDAKFGRDKYVVIPIGRSLSSIGKCLGYKIGENNVKVLPMSNAARFIDIEYCTEDFDALRQYLNSVGLSENEVETSGKTYIFTDFCDTGASMLGVKRLFNNKIWGCRDNVKFINVVELMYNSESGKARGGDLVFKLGLEDLLYGCDFKPYSFVKQCKDLSSTKYSLVNTADSPEKIKCFWFKLLDNEMKKKKFILL